MLSLRNSGLQLCKKARFVVLFEKESHKCVSRSLSTSVIRNTSRQSFEIKKFKTNLQQEKSVKISDEFMQQQVQRYKLSKRRLANMMGEDPDSYNDYDVKRAIRYLFPSDLNEESAPSLDDPLEVFTSTHKIQSGAHGRPLHYLYFTGLPNFYEWMHQAYQHVIDLRKLDDITPTHNLDDELSRTRLMTKEELMEEVLDGEPIADYHYRQFLAQFDQLLMEPEVYRIKDFIMKVRKEVPVASMMVDVQEVSSLEDGRQFVEEDGRKKTAIAQVKLLYPGTGQITVNGKSFLRYFRYLDDRQTVISPFCFLNCLMKYDVEATVTGAVWTAWKMKEEIRPPNWHHRKAAQACAIRTGISRALRSFVTKDEVEMLRRAGLLTHDKRMKERKLPGQWKARKKFTWKKR